MNNKLIIACAGAGKTTYLINTALNLKNKKILITTFTDENTESIKNKFIKNVKAIPPNVHVQPWFSFIIEHCIKPFQGKLLQEDINGLLLVNGQSGLRYYNGKIPVYWPESNLKKHYFSNQMEIYSDKIAKFAIKCNAINNGLVLQRIKSLYDYIFIDEIQDMAGYDFELIKMFMEYGISIIMVGDPRQSTFKTHYDGKYKKYNGYNIKNFFHDNCLKICQIDETSLNITHRNNEEIINYANLLYPEFIPAKTDFQKTNNLTGVFFIKKKDVDKFLKTVNTTIIRYNKNYFNENSNVYNIGKSKGLEFDNTLLFLTQNMIDWFFDQTIGLKASTRSALYVALTRAKFSCGIVIDDNFYDKKIEIKQKINSIEIYKIK